MDTRTHQQGQQVDVEAKVASIRANMPSTYQNIRDKAARQGTGVFTMVRRGLRGEANCFYAIEAGYVEGTPFNVADVDAELARYMVQFNPVCVVMWSADLAGDKADPIAQTPATPLVGTTTPGSPTGNSNPVARAFTGVSVG